MIAYGFPYERPSVVSELREWLRVQLLCLVAVLLLATVVGPFWWGVWTLGRML